MGEALRYYFIDLRIMELKSEHFGNGQVSTTNAGHLENGGDRKQQTKIGFWSGQNNVR